MTNLLQIHEPGETPDPHEIDPGLAIGIDLGTTNSVVSVVGNSGKPEIIRDENGALLLPSVVAYPKGEPPLVGDDALGYLGVDPSRVVSSVKRLMGRGVSDFEQVPYKLVAGEGGMVRIVIEEKSLTPVEVSAVILKSLRVRAEQALGQMIHRAVITVPAYFDDASRLATKEAARLAGLEVLRLVNEPTAAALYYGLDHNAEGLYVVYDLGGGTFDLSVLRLEKGIFRVLATGGDAALGGDDLDRMIVEAGIRKNGVKFSLSQAEQKLALREARRAKEELSNAAETEFLIGIGNHIQLTRTQFEEMATPFVDRTIMICKRVLQDADIAISDVKGVVLVGGSTRIPLVREKVAALFKTQPLGDVDPDLVVAKGAALQAHALTQGSDTLLLDVLPLSLGLEMMGGIVERIIERNTPIPVAKAQEFTTYQDGQTGMLLHVLQGERETVEYCRSLARFEFKDIPPMVAGAARIKVTFAVDADGLLTATAEEMTSHRLAAIEVKPSYGLSEDEMAQMLRDSFEHGREDIERRLWLEAKVEAERVLHALDAAIKVDSSLLKSGELAAIDALRDKIAAAIGRSDRDLVNGLVEKLEKLTHPFAQRRVDRAISLALKGQYVDEVEAELMAAPIKRESD